MAIYHIDPTQPAGGDGSIELPFNSFAALPTVVAGDSIRVKRGTTLVMGAKYTLPNSGTLGNFITIEDYGSGDRPIIIPFAQGQGCVDAVGRNYVRLRNLWFMGNLQWTSQASYAVRFNGGGNDNYLENCRAQYLGVGYFLDGGFSKTRVLLINCEALDNTSDGVRVFSAAGTYTWDGLNILGGTYSRNGRALGANGCGINIYIQNGHTTAVMQNLRIEGVTVEDNYRAGIICNDDSVAWATISAAANTTPPTRQIKGVNIQNNTIRRNGGAGLSVQAAQPSATMGVVIRKNLMDGNGIRTTLGNIWTGGCLRPLIELNKCYRAVSNGTTVGDGIGIFDDQWNDSAVIRWNLIQDNVFDPAVNPEYTSYGIGIYRATGGKHYGNIIRGCRYGFIVGNVPTATQPVMASILIEGNSIIDTVKHAIKLWFDLPAGCATIRNNYIDGCQQPMSADGVNAGNQTFTTNKSTRYTNATTGANITNGTTFDGATSLVLPNGRPYLGSSLIGAGTYAAGVWRDHAQTQRSRPPCVGAYDLARFARQVT